MGDKTVAYIDAPCFTNLSYPANVPDRGKEQELCSGLTPRCYSSMQTAINGIVIRCARYFIYKHNHVNATTSPALAILSPFQEASHAGLSPKDLRQVKFF